VHSHPGPRDSLHAEHAAALGNLAGLSARGKARMAVPWSRRSKIVIKIRNLSRLRHSLISYEGKSREYPEVRQVHPVIEITDNATKGGGGTFSEAKSDVYLI